MIQKKIAIVGRARTGKSFLVSMFSKDAYQYRRLFCEEGSDKTACPVHNYFYKNETKMKSRIIFYSNFESLYNKNTDEEVKAILEEWKALREISGIREEEEHEPEGNSLSIDPDEDGANESLNRIENLIRRMNQYENDKNLTRSEQYFEVHLKAGELCDSLFDKETDVLEVIDVPGVSGDVKFRAMKADLYIFVLRSDNEKEAGTIQEIVKELKAYLSGAKVCFLYKGGERPDNEEEYDADTLKIQKAMKDFEQYFEDLRGSIISSSIEALYPASHSLLYPIMKAEQPSKAEEIFRKRLSDKLRKVFLEKLEKPQNNVQRIKDKASEIKEVKEFIIKMISHIPSYELDESRKLYTLQDFSTEQHGRTKTGDESRLLYKMYDAYQREKGHIYRYFEQFSAIDYTDWQAEIIKDLFIIIGSYIDMDNGMLDSNHWKEYPQTMWIEEGVLSAEIIENRKIFDERFVELFASFGIQGSWRNVEKNCLRHEMTDKLTLVKEVLVDRPVYSLEEMVLYRYIMGFRVLAIHRILTEIGLSKEESIALLKELSY